MKRNDEHKIWQTGTIIVMTVVMAMVLQWVQEYRFYAKECEHLWLNDWMWIAPHFSQPGGMVQLLTSALTQFFCLKWVGAITIACVFGLVLLLGQKIMQRLNIDFCFLSMVPAYRLHVPLQRTYLFQSPRSLCHLVGHLDVILAYCRI